MNKIQSLKELAFCLIVLLTFSASADNVKTISGEYTFYADDSHSLSDCKRLSLEGARIEALANEYGTIVESTVSYTEQLVNNREKSAFVVLNSTEVKGEWIADDGEPSFDISLANDGHYVVKCKIKGKSRPFSNESTDFKALVLKNGKDPRFSDTIFKSGDKMFVYFQAPIDGFVAIYLASEDGNVYTLLPYISTTNGHVKVKGNKEYVFFDRDDRQFGKVDSMKLVTESDSEYNQIYVIFSPHEFTKAIDSFSEENLPRRLSYVDFNKWIAEKRKRDPKMSMKQVNILIQN